MKKAYLAIESKILSHDVHSNGEQSVTGRQVDALIRSGLYQRSSGSPVGAAHWRRSLPDGSCLHLVIERQRKRLHHDAFDPHASLISLGMHVTQEAPSEAVSLATLAWSMVKLLAR
jgi:hypothetical protein